MWFFLAIGNMPRAEKIRSFAKFGLTVAEAVFMEPQLPKQASDGQARLSGASSCWPV
jgi:hypothetical protein